MYSLKYHSGEDMNELLFLVAMVLLVLGVFLCIIGLILYLKLNPTAHKENYASFSECKNGTMNDRVFSERHANIARGFVVKRSKNGHGGKIVLQARPSTEAISKALGN